ncbi:MAG: HlyD family efflux transporter periplasmic adaptor subunit [Plectolyngbya sp. WJT66-NPBG17]|jgi:HlyD family type I secretion membrane fusion protein|nr:HlyD family efflux transporter periplasmic adaptor subunit [Plectolyngbya sp. WJT66-NPBG17]
MYHRFARPASDPAPSLAPSAEPTPPVKVLEPPRSTDWSQPVQTVLDQPPSSLPFQLAIGGFAFATCFIGWAWLSQINEVSHAQGKLIPRGEVFKVDPIDTGKVARVLVQEGQPVQKGQVLLELDHEIAATEVDRLEKELSSAQTELNQTRMMIGQAQLQAAARSTMARSQTQAQSIELLKAQEASKSTETLVSQLQDETKAHQERLDRLQPLVSQGALPQEQVFQAEQAIRERERAMTESQGTLVRSQSESQRLAELVKQQQADEQNVQLEAQQQIEQLKLRQSQLQAKIAQIQTLIDTAKVKLKDRYVYAPVNGNISALKVHNPGEVVQLGQTIAEIAPENRPIVVSAVLPNSEAGLVKVGMPVQLKFDAFPYQDFGVVPGKVKQISPDSKSDPQLGQVYRLEIELDRTTVTKGNQTIALKSGQTATAEIITRQRRMIDVFLDPIRQLQKGGFNL